MLAGYAWAGPRLPEAQARAFAVASLVVGKVVLIVSNRSTTQPLRATLRTPNRSMWLVVVLAGALLHFAPLPPQALAAACGLGLAGLRWLKGLKAARPRRSGRLVPVP